MLRKLRTLGVAVVAMFVLTAVAASAASAAAFHSEKSPTFLLGEQKTENGFTTTAGTVKCKKAPFTSGEIIGTSDASVEITPAYSECTAFGQAAEVTTTGCKYKLIASTATEGNVAIV